MPSVHALLAELSPCHWVIVEGWKHAGMPKLEVWRAEVGQPPLYPEDPFVAAVATDDPAALPVPTGLPVFQLDDADGVARWLLAQGGRFDYDPEIHVDG
jgi:molybdopterin-guanine dinucleotide biosynthesis protein B